MSCTKLVSESPIAEETPDAYILQNGQTVQKQVAGPVQTYTVYKNKVWTGGTPCKTMSLTKNISSCSIVMVSICLVAIPFLNMAFLPVTVLGCCSMLFSIIASFKGLFSMTPGLSRSSSPDVTITYAVLKPIVAISQSIARAVVDEPQI